MISKLSILGSTGSVGTQTLSVAKKLGIEIVSLSAKDNIKLLEQQIREFKPKFVAVFDCKAASVLRKNVKDLQVTIFEGIDGLCQVASIDKCDIVLNSLIGMVGLRPTIEAIKSGKNVALANKETLVVGGNIVKEEAKKRGVKIIPVDSEHSAIFQCVQGCNNREELKKIILTASGGPFWGKTREELQHVNINQALKHPNWNMGPKITIDSATMMNKGLEIIEAVHLFDLPEDKIDVLVHRESIVHSMIEYIDNSVIAQLGVPDMKLAIQYAITYPERITSDVESLDLTKGSLTFYNPKNENCKCINLCRKAIRIGGTMPAVLNAANEEAVKMFLDNRIKFIEIEQIVENAINYISICKKSNFSDIINADLKTREYVKNIL